MKEQTNLSDLFYILDLIEKMKIPYWIEGGWGVDILNGKETREHRDIDVDFDGNYEELFLDKLKEIGYEIVTDCRPARVELYHNQYGFLDIHPLHIGDDGSIKQYISDVYCFDFEKEWFSSGVLHDRKIPCYSLKAQKLFHSGYELRDKDEKDIEILNRI